MVLDANTGAVLHNDDGDEARHPASLTKMMTLYLTFETIDAGRLSMSDRVKISQEAASQAPSKLDLEVGEDISVFDAVRALITMSANDVAVALAEKVGGSERNFVRLMNTRARELGMKNTNFENASGLPHRAQITTARDMITLGLRLQDDFPNHYRLFATRAFSFNRSTYRNHNTMLNNFQGIDGIKTGYTSASGFNLVSSVHRGGRHLVAAVFGGSSAASRNGEMRNLLTRALNRASTVKTRKPMPSLIARLKAAPKLAERPKPIAKPAVQVAAALPALVLKPVAAVVPKPVAAVVPVAAAPLAAEITTVAVAETPAAETAAPIDVFKVKRIMVAPRQGPRPPAPRPDETTDMAPEGAPDETASLPTAPFSAADAPGPADQLAQTFAAEGLSATETVIPKLTLASSSDGAEASRRPTALDDRIAMLGAGDIEAPIAAVAVAPVEAQLEPAAVPEPIPVAAKAAPRPRFVQAGAARPAVAKINVPAGPVRAPSSLQAQAAQFGAPQRVASLQPSTTAARPAPATDRYEVQIGAYGSIDEAQRALASAQQRGGRLLAGYASVTHPVQKPGGRVFRARFTGFDANRAATTCSELRRQAIDCFVMTAE